MFFILYLQLLIINISSLRFKKLDLDNSGSLSVDEFMSLPELQQNPLVQRVIGKSVYFIYVNEKP